KHAPTLGALESVDLRRQQVSQAVEEVQRVIHCLTTEISHQDIRFQAVPYSDIYNGNIKVLAPSQFLVTVPVKGLAGYREARERRWRYYTLQGTRIPCPLRDPEGLQQWLEVEQFMKSLWQWHEADVNIEGDIVPAKVLLVFRKLVENAIRTCHLSGKVSLLANCEAVWVAVETTACQVEIELVPTVEIPTAWSEKAQWPRCLKRWPSPEKVECLKSFGFNLLAHAGYHWQLSFSQAEQMLLEQLDEDGYRWSCSILPLPSLLRLFSQHLNMYIILESLVVLLLFKFSSFAPVVKLLTLHVLTSSLISIVGFHSRQREPLLVQDFCDFKFQFVCLAWIAHL
uniref:Mab-21 like 3 n=1 Tax=Spermophilus dauricus TaxID=99837 RepID=A0A8C9UU29_SPEDA